MSTRKKLLLDFARLIGVALAMSTIIACLIRWGVFIYDLLP
jgi:hypothetical protein